MFQALGRSIPCSFYTGSRVRFCGFFWISLYEFILYLHIGALSVLTTRKSAPHLDLPANFVYGSLTDEIALFDEAKKFFGLLYYAISQ